MRHGETSSHQKGKCQSPRDPLNRLGKEHARGVAKALKKKSFDVAYVSSMKRARDTAKEILKHHKDIPVVIEKNIREAENGRWAGKPREWRNKQREQIAKRKGISFWQVKSPGGESVEDAKKRATKFIQNLLKKNHNSTLIVSHGYPTFYMLKFLLGFGYEQGKKYFLGPGEYSVIEIKSKKPKLTLNKAKGRA